MSTPKMINLLYIEDDESSRELIVSYLKKSKYTKFNVKQLCSLEVGLKYLRKKCVSEKTCDIDLILLDLILPNSHGVSTYEEVKKACSFVPVVIISGYEDLACKCVKLGAQDYLVKPTFTYDTLTKSLTHAVERSKLEKLKIKAEQKYRQLVEVTGAGIYEIDFINKKFVYVNNVMCKNLGYTKEEFLALENPFEILTYKSLNKWNKRWTSLQTGESTNRTFEYEGIRKDGSSVWLLTTSEYIEDENKNIIGATVVAIDITESKLIMAEAKQREEYIFNELESRIHQWREEISDNVIKQKDKIKSVSFNLQKIINNSGVSTNG